MSNGGISSHNPSRVAPIMNELGQWLRENREAQGLSLAEIEDKTRIRQKFLAALEAEEWDILPGDVTAKGFLRKYANHLGLDAEQVTARLNGSIDQPEEEIVVAEEPVEEQEADYESIEMDLKTGLLDRLTWQQGLSGVALLALVVAAWWLFSTQSSRISAWTTALSRPLLEPVLAVAANDTPEPTATRLVLRVTATPTALPTTEPTPLPQTLPVSDAAAQPIESAPADTLHLHLEVSQRSWVRITVDDQVRLESVLEPGEQRDWEGAQSIDLRTGNAAGVVVTVNGQERGALGEIGEVVELRWSLDQGQLVELTPTALPENPAQPAGSLADAATPEAGATEEPEATAEATVEPQAKSVAEAETSKPTAEPKAQATSATETPESAETAAPTATPKPAKTSDTGQKLAVGIRVTAASWMRVTVDGKQQLEAILEPGSERSWEGETVQLRIGNAGGVIVTVNGQERGLLGETGDVVDLVWSLNTTGKLTERIPD